MPPGPTQYIFPVQPPNGIPYETPAHPEARKVWNPVEELYYDAAGYHEKPRTRSVFVWFDGACRNNGSPYARAAWGVYFGDGSRHNERGLLKSSAPQTNSRAEIEGLVQTVASIRRILHDLDLLKNRANARHFDEIQICSDSEYLVKSMTLWIEGWIRSGGRRSRNNEVAHFDVLRTVYEQLRDLALFHNIWIVFWHVPREMNREADRLANEPLNETAPVYMPSIRPATEEYCWSVWPA
ncbi:ribonuclease H-like domain-containing protein [Echria macrotheca]|uniref:ribonuclease H n=1 Tax=Echria macrotheca TaxID=438768 RepID=A0AAJ0F770_9PEZI|nr:ribonuclease H-like domain-containing protein [Echria macrotheca]